jgi:hypothetical protein
MNHEGAEALASSGLVVAEGTGALAVPGATDASVVDGDDLERGWPLPSDLGTIAEDIQSPKFLSAWRGYDRHQVDTFARQSLAVVHALRRRAQRAEQRVSALEQQLRAHRAATPAPPIPDAMPGVSRPETFEAQTEELPKPSAQS